MINAGRLIGIMVMTMGVGLFGTLAGFIANKLLAPYEGTGPVLKGGPLGAGLAATQNTLHEQKQQKEQLLERLNRIDRQLRDRSPDKAVIHPRKRNPP